MTYPTDKLSFSVQMAFILAGCTHATYKKVLQHSLGMDAVQMNTFITIIHRMYPTVKQMVDEMCEEAKNDMKRMGDNVLGSFKRACT